MLRIRICVKSDLNICERMLMNEFLKAILQISLSRVKEIDANMIDYVQEWLQRTIAKVDALLMQVCRKFEAEKCKVVSQYVMPDVIC